MAIYMKYKDITGDVTETGHVDWIELHSFGVGMGRGISSPVGSSAERESTAPTVTEIVVTKENDMATGKLIQEALTGLGETVKIDFTRTNKGKMEVYMKLELSETMISGYQQQSGSDRPVETLSLNFTKISFNTIQMKGDGKPGQPFTTVYDLSKAQTS